MANIKATGFKNCLADSNIWMRHNAKPNGTPYWEYIFIYMDNIFTLLYDSEKIINYLHLVCTLKPNSKKLVEYRQYNFEWDSYTWII